MNIKPMNAQIIVKPYKKPSETESGFILSVSEEGKPVQGEIVAIGDKVADVAIGDIIFFKKYVPDEIEIEREMFLILSEKDVLAVVK